MAELALIRGCDNCGVYGDVSKTGYCSACRSYNSEKFTGDISAIQAAVRVKLFKRLSNGALCRQGYTVENITEDFFLQEYSARLLVETSTRA